MTIVYIYAKVTYSTNIFFVVTRFSQFEILLGYLSKDLLFVISNSPGIFLCTISHMIWAIQSIHNCKQSKGTAIKSFIISRQAQ